MRRLRHDAHDWRASRLCAWDGYGDAMPWMRWRRPPHRAHSNARMVRCHGRYFHICLGATLITGLGLGLSRLDSLIPLTISENDRQRPLYPHRCNHDRKTGEETSVRGMRKDWRQMGSSANVPDMRCDAVLRRLAQQARLEARALDH